MAAPMNFEVGASQSIALSSGTATRTGNYSFVGSSGTKNQTLIIAILGAAVFVAWMVLRRK